jgi:phage gp29-like protein
MATARTLLRSAPRPAASRSFEAELQREIATVLNDITHPYTGAILTNPDPTLLSRAGARGLALYDDIERDAHARALLTRRKNLAAYAKWDLLPASDKARDRKAAEFVRKVLNDMRFATIRYQLLDSILKGFAVGEVMWGRREDHLVITEVRSRDQRRFTFGVDGKLRLLVPGQAAYGIALPERKFIVNIFDRRNHNPYGTAMGGTLWWLVQFKKEVTKHWLGGSGRFGFPTVVAKVPSTYDEEEQEKVLQAAESAYSEAAAVIPEDVELDLLESKRANDTSLHRELIGLLNSEMSEAVLTQSATMGLGRSGSYAATETFSGFEKSLGQADADTLDETLTDTLVRWLVEVNYPGAGIPRLVSDLTNEADLTERAKRDGLIMGLGFQADEEYVQSMYGSHWKRSQAPTQLPPAVAGNFNGPRAVEPA